MNEVIIVTDDTALKTLLQLVVRPSDDDPALTTDGISDRTFQLLVQRGFLHLTGVFDEQLLDGMTKSQLESRLVERGLRLSESRDPHTHKTQLDTLWAKLELQQSHKALLPKLPAIALLYSPDWRAKVGFTGALRVVSLSASLDLPAAAPKDCVIVYELAALTVFKEQFDVVYNPVHHGLDWPSDALQAFWLQLDSLNPPDCKAEVSWYAAPPRMKKRLVPKPECYVGLSAFERQQLQNDLAQLRHDVKRLFDPTQLLELSYPFMFLELIHRLYSPQDASALHAEKLVAHLRDEIMPFVFCFGNAPRPRGEISVNEKLEKLEKPLYDALRELFTTQAILIFEVHWLGNLGPVCADTTELHAQLKPQATRLKASVEKLLQERGCPFKQQQTAADAPAAATTESSDAPVNALALTHVDRGLADELVNVALRFPHAQLASLGAVELKALAGELETLSSTFEQRNNRAGMYSKLLPQSSEAVSDRLLYLKHPTIKPMEATYVPSQQEAAVAAAKPAVRGAGASQQAPSGESPSAPLIADAHKRDDIFRELCHAITTCEDPKQVFLLLGESGSGKTQLAANVVAKLQQEFVEQTSNIIPLFIPLRSLDYPNHDAVREHLKRLGLNDGEIHDLQSRKSRMLFVFDGYDEIVGHGIKPIYETNRLGKEWPNATVLITCRLEFSQAQSDYRQYFRPAHDDSRLREYHLRELPEKKVQKYLEDFLMINELEAKKEDAQRRVMDLLRLPGLRPMLRTPYIVELLGHVLADAKASNELTAHGHFKLADLYHSFLDVALQKGLLSADAESARKLGYDVSKPTCLAHVQGLAWDMYLKNACAVKHHLNETKFEGQPLRYNEPIAGYFGHPHSRLLLLACPLVKVRPYAQGTMYEFRHASIGEYLAARSLLEKAVAIHGSASIIGADGGSAQSKEVSATEQLQSRLQLAWPFVAALGQRKLTQSMVNFLVDFVRNDTNFRTILFDILFAAPEWESNVLAAGDAQAMSVSLSVGTGLEAAQTKSPVDVLHECEANILWVLLSDQPSLSGLEFAQLRPAAQTRLVRLIADHAHFRQCTFTSPKLAGATMLNITHDASVVSEPEANKFHSLFKNTAKNFWLCNTDFVAVVDHDGKLHISSLSSTLESTNNVPLPAELSALKVAHFAWCKGGAPVHAALLTTDGTLHRLEVSGTGCKSLASLPLPGGVASVSGLVFDAREHITVVGTDAGTLKLVTVRWPAAPDTSAATSTASTCSLEVENTSALCSLEVQNTSTLHVDANDVFLANAADGMWHSAWPIVAAAESVKEPYSPEPVAKIVGEPTYREPSQTDSLLVVPEYLSDVTLLQHKVVCRIRIAAQSFLCLCDDFMAVAWHESGWCVELGSYIIKTSPAQDLAKVAADLAKAAAALAEGAGDPAKGAQDLTTAAAGLAKIAKYLAAVVKGAKTPAVGAEDRANMAESLTKAAVAIDATKPVEDLATAAKGVATLADDLAKALEGWINASKIAATVVKDLANAAERLAQTAADTGSAQELAQAAQNLAKAAEQTANDAAKTELISKLRRAYFRKTTGLSLCLELPGEDPFVFQLPLDSAYGESHRMDTPRTAVQTQVSLGSGRLVAHLDWVNTEGATKLLMLPVAQSTEQSTKQHMVYENNGNIEVTTFDGSLSGLFKATKTSVKPGKDKEAISLSRGFWNLPCFDERVRSRDGAQARLSDRANTFIVWSLNGKDGYTFSFSDGHGVTQHISISLPPQPCKGFMVEGSGFVQASTPDQLVGRLVESLAQESGLDSGLKDLVPFDKQVRALDCFHGSLTLEQVEALFGPDPKPEGAYLVWQSQKGFVLSFTEVVEPTSSDDDDDAPQRTITVVNVKHSRPLQEDQQGRILVPVPRNLEAVPGKHAFELLPDALKTRNLSHAVLPTAPVATPQPDDSSLPVLERQVDSAAGFLDAVSPEADSWVSADNSLKLCRVASTTGLAAFDCFVQRQHGAALAHQPGPDWILVARLTIPRLGNNAEFSLRRQAGQDERLYVQLTQEDSGFKAFFKSLVSSRPRVSIGALSLSAKELQASEPDKKLVEAITLWRKAALDPVPTFLYEAPGDLLALGSPKGVVLLRRTSDGQCSLIGKTELTPRCRSVAFSGDFLRLSGDAGMPCDVPLSLLRAQPPSSAWALTSWGRSRTAQLQYALPGPPELRLDNATLRLDGVSGVVVTALQFGGKTVVGTLRPSDSQPLAFFRLNEGKPPSPVLVDIAKHLNMPEGSRVLSVTYDKDLASHNDFLAAGQQALRVWVTFFDDSNELKCRSVLVRQDAFDDAFYDLPTYCLQASPDQKTFEFKPKDSHSAPSFKVVLDTSAPGIAENGTGVKLGDWAVNLAFNFLKKPDYWHPLSGRMSTTAAATSTERRLLTMGRAGNNQQVCHVLAWRDGKFAEPTHELIVPERPIGIVLAGTDDTHHLVLFSKSRLFSFAWDATNGVYAKSCNTTPIQGVKAVAAAPDGTLIVSCTQGVVSQRRVADEGVRIGHREHVRLVSWLADESRLAHLLSVDAKGVVHLWRSLYDTPSLEAGLESEPSTSLLPTSLSAKNYSALQRRLQAHVLPATTGELPALVNGLDFDKVAWRCTFLGDTASEHAGFRLDYAAQDALDRLQSHVFFEIKTERGDVETCGVMTAAAKRWEYSDLAVLKVADNVLTVFDAGEAIALETNVTLSAADENSRKDKTLEVLGTVGFNDPETGVTGSLDICRMPVVEDAATPEATFIARLAATPDSDATPSLALVIPDQTEPWLLWRVQVETSGALLLFWHGQAQLRVQAWPAGTWDRLQNAAPAASLTDVMPLPCSFELMDFLAQHPVFRGTNTTPPHCWLFQCVDGQATAWDALSGTRLGARVLQPAPVKHVQYFPATKDNELYVGITFQDEDSGVLVEERAVLTAACLTQQPEAVDTHSQAVDPTCADDHPQSAGTEGLSAEADTEDQTLPFKAAQMFVTAVKAPMTMYSLNSQRLWRIAVQQSTARPPFTLNLDDLKLTELVSSSSVSLFELLEKVATGECCALLLPKWVGPKCKLQDIKIVGVGLRRRALLVLADESRDRALVCSVQASTTALSPNDGLLLENVTGKVAMTNDGVHLAFVRGGSEIVVGQLDLSAKPVLMNERVVSRPTYLAGRLALHIAPDGCTLLAAVGSSAYMLRVDKDNKDTFEFEDVVAGVADTSFNNIGHVSWSPNGQSLILGRGDGQVELYQVEQATCFVLHIAARDPQQVWFGEDNALYVQQKHHTWCLTPPVHRPLADMALPLAHVTTAGSDLTSVLDARGVLRTLGFGPTNEDRPAALGLCVPVLDVAGDRPLDPTKARVAWSGPHAVVTDGVEQLRYLRVLPEATPLVQTVHVSYKLSNLCTLALSVGESANTLTMTLGNGHQQRKWSLGTPGAFGSAVCSLLEVYTQEAAKHMLATEPASAAGPDSSTSADATHSAVTSSDWTTPAARRTWSYEFSTAGALSLRHHASCTHVKLTVAQTGENNGSPRFVALDKTAVLDKPVFDSEQNNFYVLIRETDDNGRRTAQVLSK